MKTLFFSSVSHGSGIVFESRYDTTAQLKFTNRSGGDDSGSCPLLQSTDEHDGDDAEDASSPKRVNESLYEPEQQLRDNQDLLITLSSQSNAMPNGGDMITIDLED